MEAPIRGKAPVLGPFFKRLESGAREASDGYSFCAEIGGKKLSMYFPSRERAHIAERCFAGLRVPDTSESDARFFFWADDCSRYMVPDGPWRCREGDSLVLCLPGRRVIGADAARRRYYYCGHDPERRAAVPYWAVSGLVSQWAASAGLLSVHGGAVGAGGRGVLLAAQGGGGKSTLAASCLLSGMDYVTDDHVLVSAEGPLRAVPVFSTLKLNPDMEKRLGVRLPVIWEDAARGGKLLLDASSFPICRDMAVRAVVFPSRWDRERAEISPAPGHSALRLAQSALRVEGAYDPFMAKTIVRRLSELPAYEMRLGKNLEQNADTLRTWIERMG